MRRIERVDDLESVVGAPPLPVLMKSIPVLDDHCQAILALAPVAVVGYRDADGRQRAELVGGAPGFAAPDGAAGLSLPIPASAADGSAISTLFLVPGWREALRINGRRSGPQGATLAVDEAFVHCGKAVLRSKLWRDDAPTLADDVGSSPASFLAACPFVVLATEDAEGNADASPKGDPDGFVHHVDDHTVAIPDRRGNRRTDTLHNLVADPRVALLGLVPGLDHTLEVTGEAHVTDDDALCSAMAVGDKAPKTAIVISIEHTEVSPSGPLADARLWDHPRDRRPDLPAAGKIWSDHVKRNDTKGVKASLVRAGANGAIVQAGTEQDYRRLY